MILWLVVGFRAENKRQPLDAILGDHDDSAFIRHQDIPFLSSQPYSLANECTPSPSFLNTRVYNPKLRRDRIPTTPRMGLRGATVKSLTNVAIGTWESQGLMIDRKDAHILSFPHTTFFAPTSRILIAVVHDPAVQNTHQSVGTWTGAEEEHTIKSGVRDSDGKYEGVGGAGVM
ncbi:hypothetical protein Moror_16282 [Moniliophthora roreri MCA 2997]|uniref:Uncharacterized protein n=1 Tax=Moniliophthora roreri (strain MCA 2997) TaxID=1381753 RepID=V2WKE5_MONRO|nr:hypothetical protein Moror_16282 [Moniliophthora roreri MCA 2997]